MPAKGNISNFNGQHKKYTLFRTFEILNDYSDEKHHLKHSEIQEKLSTLYDLNVNRKLVRENIDDINFLGQPYGIEVKSEKGNGAYLLGRRFEKSEIAFLIDAVFSSKSIGQRQAVELSGKLQTFLSKNDRKSFKYISKSSDVVRTDSKQVFYNIDSLLYAIEKKKKVQFNYNRFYLDDGINEKMKKRTFVASPYYLVNNQGKYYLVCNNDKFDDIANYRVDRIFNIKVLDEDVKNIKTMKGCENGFDVVKYANENIYMFSCDSVEATIKIENNYAINYVYDWFGTNSKIYMGKDKNIYATIHANEQALIYWCLQYGESIELLKPLNLREKITKIVKNINKKYEGVGSLWEKI